MPILLLVNIRVFSSSVSITTVSPASKYLPPPCVLPWSSNSPSKYFGWFLAVTLIIFGYLKFTKKNLNIRQIAWICYLFVISVVEEIGFRLGLPLLFTSEFIGIDIFWIGIILSNFIFAIIHYFTLRWKLTACVFTFLGGMGFSRLFSVTGDLALVILVHWAVTFLNTPSAPKGLNNPNLKD